MPHIIDGGEPVDRLARFEREAKALAALSHPNILVIHDFGREGEVTYAVTELLDGETLRHRIGQGALAPGGKQWGGWLIRRLLILK